MVFINKQIELFFFGGKISRNESLQRLGRGAILSFLLVVMIDYEKSGESPPYCQASHVQYETFQSKITTSYLTFWRRNYFFNFSTPCI